ncbi:TolC family protein [Sphingomonas solaris]|uniref:Agglutination protein n=1 Tax=Alterirhizorhabdus solaris TaxID=2529389 RepID=A0A558QZA2_9SPHN|nr:TolC family protein [Sphingomonas solaris]TVV72439.1 agglutination protein [Sphingomonas solaris]
MFSSTGKARSLRAIALMLLGSAALAPAGATDLREAIAVAVQSNPQINQAVANKEAIEFEREQAQGLYRPRVSVEASAGARRTDTPTRRVLGSDDDVLAPVEGSLLVEQTLFDSGARRAELSRQAARTDGAANRVEERSQFIALEVARRYIDYLLQQRIVAAADDNITFHRKLTDDLREGVRSGSISIADQQQAEERLQASLARRTEAQEELTNAAISFRTLTGLPLDSATVPPALTAKLPATLEDAIAAARTNNPLVREAMADIDAAYAVRDAAKANLGPRVALEGRARYGQDVDGFRGHASDLYGRVVARWNLYTGGIDQANVQESTRRASETRFRLHEVTRQAEEDARTAWNRLRSQAGLVGDLDRQRAVADDLIVSYREQFNVGRRSLLDLLDSQNTRYNVVVQAETARLAELFAQYRVLASTNELLAAVDVAPQKAAIAGARARFDVKVTPAAEVMERRLPN